MSDGERGGGTETTGMAADGNVGDGGVNAAMNAGGGRGDDAHGHPVTLRRQEDEQPSGGTDERPEYVDFSVEDFPGGLQGCLEAILMSCDQPQQPHDLARVLAVDDDAVMDALRRIRARYEAGAGPGNAVCGFELHCSARGWQFCSRPEYESVVAAFVHDGQTAHLSQAALEVLSVVAYKQPVTRAGIASIRGVASDRVVRSLCMRGLIREQGVDEDTRAALLVTTDVFLENMGLPSLDDLPSLAPFLPSVHSVIDEAEDHGGRLRDDGGFDGNLGGSRDGGVDVGVDGSAGGSAGGSFDSSADRSRDGSAGGNPDGGSGDGSRTGGRV